MTTPPKQLEAADIVSHIEGAWKDNIAVLEQYIRIPNVSKAYNNAWDRDGHLDNAVELLRQWCQSQVTEWLSDATVARRGLLGRTPVLVIDVPATNWEPVDPAAQDTVILYGHLDKQPPLDGWRTGLGPWNPVVDGDRLYGRGSADDGYAVFAALTAIAAVRAAGGQHARCLVLIEASEESGSPDLPAHLEALGDQLGSPSLVVCLDSSCGDWERLWVTTSLRGLVDMELRVDVLGDGVHSGDAGGIVPSSFRILRHLLERIEDSATGRLLLPELQVEIPGLRCRQADRAAALREDVAGEYPLVPGVSAMDDSSKGLLLNQTWRPALEVVGFDGAPPPTAAGSVQRPYTAAKLSFRIPPTASARAAAQAICDKLTSEPPHGAKVTVTRGVEQNGWHARPEPAVLLNALDEASVAGFGQPALLQGDGGAIPFLEMLGRRFPQAQFVVTGVLGPGSNAHGPNEFLHIPTARRLTVALAHLLNAHGRH